MLDDKATEKGQDQENNNVDITEIREQLNTLTKQLESTKKELSSRDSKISEYQNQLKEREASLEEMKNSSLSEAEKMQLEMEKLKLEFQNERNSRTKADNKAKALELMSEQGIDKRYIDFIPLDDTEAMLEKIKSLSEIAVDLKNQGAKSVINKLGSDIPTGGHVPQGKITREQYQALSPAERDKAFREGRIIGIGS